MSSPKHPKSPKSPEPRVPSSSLHAQCAKPPISLSPQDPQSPQPQAGPGRRHPGADGGAQPWPRKPPVPRALPVTRQRGEGGGAERGRVLPVGHQLHHLCLHGQLRGLHGRRQGCGRGAPRGWARRGVRLRVGAAGPGGGVPAGATSAGRRGGTSTGGWAGTGTPAHPRGDWDLPAQVAQPPQQGLAPSLSFPSQHRWFGGGGVGRGRELGDPPLPPLPGAAAGGLRGTSGLASGAGKRGAVRRVLGRGWRPGCRAGTPWQAAQSRLCASPALPAPLGNGTGPLSGAGWQPGHGPAAPHRPLPPPPPPPRCPCHPRVSVPEPHRDGRCHRPQGMQRGPSPGRMQRLHQPGAAGPHGERGLQPSLRS